MDTLTLNRVPLRLAGTKITKLSKKENSIEKTDSKHVPSPTKFSHLVLQETCKVSSGWCLADTGHYLLSKLQVPFHAAVEYIRARESKKENETSINICFASLQLLSFSKTCRSLSFLFI